MTVRRLPPRIDALLRTHPVSATGADCDCSLRRTQRSEMNRRGDPPAPAPDPTSAPNAQAPHATARASACNRPLDRCSPATGTPPAPSTPCPPTPVRRTSRPGHATPKPTGHQSTPTTSTSLCDASGSPPQRWLEETAGVSIDDAVMVACCLAALGGHCPDEGADSPPRMATTPTVVV
jgi:hypothetical protein